MLLRFSLLSALCALGAVQAASASAKVDVDVKTDNAVRRAREVMMASPEAAYWLAVRMKNEADLEPKGNRRDIKLGKAFSIAAEAKYRQLQPKLAQSLADRAYSLAVKTGDIQTQGDALLTRGSMNYDAGDMAGAMTSYLSAMSRFQKVDNDRSQSIALQYLAQVYKEAADYNRADHYFREAAEVYSSDPTLNFSLLDNRALTFATSGRSDAALRISYKALQIARSLNTWKFEHHVLVNMVLYQVSLGKIAEAEATLSRAKRLAAANGASMSDTMVEAMAEVAFAKKDYQLAKILLERSISWPASARSKNATFQDFDLAYRVYKAVREPGKALDYLERVHKTRERALRDTLSARASLMAARFDFANQELRIEKLKAREMRRGIEHDRSIFLWLGALVVVVIGALSAILVILGRNRGVMRRKNKALAIALAEVRDSQAAQMEATRLAETDALTGLPNRRYLSDKLGPDIERDLEDGMQCSVMLLDLDRFKPINDIHGHDAGDAVLVEVAVRLRSIIADYGARAVRLGGDEFMVVVTAQKGDHVPTEVARRLINRLGAPYTFGDLEVNIGTSIGIARKPADGVRLQQILRAADLAMYEAKRAGRETYRFYNDGMIGSEADEPDSDLGLRLASRR
jgi:diguanylate cyclase (GGDEF)-like protein